ncbi:uncharacterized protein LOC128222870 [Mya arenaria]|uniref:uncharacterized protein LOC128222870 n=1 Tax=Mya arenaria TaxID=6604 RepID=UPI0022E0F189|nr:uncharacterized protein LOC128222870 [Mya arenaria]
MASTSETDELENDFPIIPLETNGETDETVLKCLIEVALLSVGGVPNINRLNFEATKGKFKKVFPWETHFETKRAGSTIDLLFITKFNTETEGKSEKSKSGYSYNTDIDMLFIPTSVAVVNDETFVEDNTIAVIEPTSQTSYINLRYNENCNFKISPSILSTKENTADRYISSQKLLRTMQKHMNVKQEAVEIVGPSLAVLPEQMEKVRDLMTSVDIVFAFRNKDWPSLGIEWITRDRPNDWPPKKDLDELYATGSHVVPKSNKSSSPEEADIMWKLSFNLAERRLAELMDTKQRYCFLIVKGIVKDSKSKALSSYSLKNVLWWMLERGDSTIWTAQTIGRCLDAYLCELIQAAKNHKIENFFMPGENLIEHVDKRSMEVLIHRLEKARGAPMSAIIGNTILTQNPARVFSMTPEKEFHFEQLRSKLMSYESIERDQQGILQIVCYHFINLGSIYAIDPNMRERAVRFIATFAEIKYPDEDPMDLVKQMLVKDAITYISSDKDPFIEWSYSCLAVIAEYFSFKELEDLLKSYDFIEENIASVLANIGCLLHRWSKADHTFWENQRQKDLTNSEKCFEHAVLNFPNNTTLLAEYAHFLLVQERYEDAIAIGRRCIAEKEENTKCPSMRFGIEDRDSVDNAIARHINFEGKIAAPPKIFGFFVTVVALKRQGNAEDGRNILRDFYSEVEKVHRDLKYDSLSLYGYACMTLGLYKEAKQPFIRADELKRGKLQEDNLEICNKAMAS